MRWYDDIHMHTCTDAHDRIRNYTLEWSALCRSVRWAVLHLKWSGGGFWRQCTSIVCTAAVDVVTPVIQQDDGRRAALYSLWYGQRPQSMNLTLIHALLITLHTMQSCPTVKYIYFAIKYFTIYNRSGTAATAETDCFTLCRWAIHRPLAEYGIWLP